jgi:hypothetical protein
MVVAGQAMVVMAGAIPSFVPVGPMVLVSVEVIVGIVGGRGDLARMLSRLSVGGRGDLARMLSRLSVGGGSDLARMLSRLSVVPVAALARVSVVVARQALVIVAGAIPSFVPVGPMVLVSVEVIIGIVGGGSDLARMLSGLSVVRVAALARVSVVVAGQARLIGAGARTVSGFVRVGLLVLAFIGIVVD